ncbi:MAG: penicillin acylase family protein [Candidatus Kariarchaeaceae archaeon]|jgi:penicillin amidase
MNSIVKKILVSILVVILSLTLGIYSGFKSTSDYHTKELRYEGLIDEVKVYRNELGIPTIIAQNRQDLFFAQGYEYARDRLWQAEFTRSVANGELSRLFGDNLTDSDKFLRTLDLKTAAEQSWEKTSDENKAIIEKYVAGLNLYIDDHIDNLPVEFQILNLNLKNPLKPFDVKPKKWSVTDALAVQGVMSYDLSFGGLNRELLRLDFAREFGVEKTLELMPIQHNQSRDYFLSIDTETLLPGNTQLSSFSLLDNIGLGFGIGSNSKVVHGDKTESGLPIVANDPHLGLTTPGIWWQVHLVAPDYHVEGYALPGIPGITLGHNEDIAWGFTNTGTDAVDLFYFKEDSSGEHYYLDDEWKEYETVTHQIPVKGGDPMTYEIDFTEYGPILDNDVFGLDEDAHYAMRWTLLVDHPRDAIVNSILGMNTARNAEEFHAALEYFGVPGQNIVYATVDGDIGYQYTGLTPIRKTEGSGVLPQNGSDPNYGWDGMIPYSQQYNVTNPDNLYFTTANEKIDTRDLFYITDMYDIGYRGERAKQFLDDIDYVTVEDLNRLQGDVLNLGAIDALDPYLPGLRTASFSGDNKQLAEDAVKELDSWDQTMNRTSVGAMLYATYRIFLEEQVFKDEMDQWEGGDDLYERYGGGSFGGGIHGLKSISTNLTSEWFDDVRTSDITESGNDIAKRAIEKTVEFLKKEIGSDIDSWKWGKLHKVLYEHVLGTEVPLLDFNEGNKASDGSDNTLKASGDTPRWTEDGPEFIQSHGPSMRFIAEVEPTWSNVWGIMSPGESGVLGNSHRGDGVNDWINNINRQWDFTTVRSSSPSFTYKKK